MSVEKPVLSPSPHGNVSLEKLDQSNHYRKMSGLIISKNTDNKQRP